MKGNEIKIRSSGDGGSSNSISDSSKFVHCK